MQWYCKEDPQPYLCEVKQSDITSHDVTLLEAVTIRLILIVGTVMSTSVMIPYCISVSLQAICVDLTIAISLLLSLNN